MQLIALSLLIFGFILIIGSILYFTLSYGISPMPSSSKAISQIRLLIPKPTLGNIYELGSGWGHLAILLAKDNPQCQVYAYEISPIPWFVSYTIAKCLRINNLSIERKDFFNVPLNDATIIVCYLYVEAMRNLKEKFKQELKPGTLIISNTFSVPKWEAKKVYYLNDCYQTPIYVYEI